MIETAIIDAKAAEQRALKVEADGKADAAAAKWQQEKIKIVAVTKAQQEFEVAEYEAKKAKETAKKILEEGRAQAEANRLKVAAGLTPLEAATIHKEMVIGVASELRQYTGNWVPTIMSSGGDTKGGNDPMEAMGINMMLEAIEKISTTKTK